MTGGGFSALVTVISSSLVTVVLKALGSALIALDGYFLTVYLCTCHGIENVLGIRLGHLNGGELVVNIYLAERLSGHSRCVNKCAKNKVRSKPTGTSCGYLQLDLAALLVSAALAAVVTWNGDYFGNVLCIL